VAYFLMKRAIRRLEKRLDYSEYGGAPLLGVSGNCVICHGSSNAKAMMNAILLASNLAKNRLNDHLIEELKEKQNMLRPGQKRSEKINGSVESIQ
jgi:glycerol-3-phosphate acyltransferase PlsX